MKLILEIMGGGVTKRKFTLTNGQAYFVTLKDSC